MEQVKATLIARITKPPTPKGTTGYSAALIAAGNQAFKAKWSNQWTTYRRLMTKPPSSKPPKTSVPTTTIPAPAAVAIGPASVKPPVATMMKPPAATKPSPAAARPAKTFSVNVLSGKKEGRKSILYGMSGGGKTTLGSMAPNAVYIPIDDGARMIHHPKTGAELRGVEGVADFQDLRDALHQTNLFNEGDTLVLDTLTKAEVFAEAHTLATVKTERGSTPENIEAYGFGKGYRHLLDTMRLIESDFEPLVRRGVNILMLCQLGNIKIANPEGLDYIAEAPKLVHTNNASVMGEFFEWADDVFRIGFASLNVVGANPKATKGKATGSGERVIYTAGGLHFKAKTRLASLPPVVSFSSPQDDSLWQFLFNGAKVGAE